MSARRLFVLSALLVLALPLGAAAQEGDRTRPVAEPARQITPNTMPARLFVIPEVAVSPLDPQTVVLTAPELRVGGCGLWVSRDAGLSWRRTADNLLIEPYQFCMQRPFGPVLAPAFGQDGTLYVAMGGSEVESDLFDGVDNATSRLHPNSPEAALLARTTDLGETHETVVIAEPEAVTTEVDGDEETVFEQFRHKRVAVDPSDPDLVYVSWTRQTTAPSAVGFPNGTYSVEPLAAEVAVSTDGGRTWGDPISLLDAADGEEVAAESFAALAVASDGTVYAFARERPPSPDDGPEPNRRLLMYTSTDQGDSWAVSVIDEGTPGSGAPSVAIDQGSDQLYLAWDEAAHGVDGDEDVPNNVFAMTSTDGGETWSDPAVVVDDDAAEASNQSLPGISVAPDGRVDIAWYDFRNDPFFGFDDRGTDGSERFADVYLASSTDGGATWSENVRASDQTIDTSKGIAFTRATRGPISVASTDALAYVTWPDTRNALDEQVEDAYFTRVRFGPGDAGAAAAGTSNDNVLWSIVGAAIALIAGGLVLVAATRTSRARSGTAALAEARR